MALNTFQGEKCVKENESVFRFVKVVFFMLTGIKFPLTSFPHCCQT